MLLSLEPEASTAKAIPAPRASAAVRFLAGMGRAMLSVLLPRLCLGCETVLGPDESWLCPVCMGSVRASVRPRKRTLEISRGTSLSISYPLDYSAAVARLITGLKYGDKPGLAGLLSGFMIEGLAEGISTRTVVVPVPVGAARRRERGYNQTELLAARIARGLGLAHEKDMLVKLRSTASQTGLERERRLRNVAGSFGVRPGFCLEGKAVLLIDDVVTTGSTLRDCARALLESGAREVSACVAASSL